MNIYGQAMNYICGLLLGNFPGKAPFRVLKLPWESTFLCPHLLNKAMHRGGAKHLTPLLIRSLIAVVLIVCQSHELAALPT